MLVQMRGHDARGRRRCFYTLAKRQVTLMFDLNPFAWTCASDRFSKDKTLVHGSMAPIAETDKNRIRAVQQHCGPSVKRQFKVHV